MTNHTVLSTLVAGWQAESGYTDVDGEWWEPGDTLLERCPSGCELDEIGWVSLLPKAPAYQCVRCCREHEFARIYVITIQKAEEVGWLPPNRGDATPSNNNSST